MGESSSIESSISPEDDSVKQSLIEQPVLGESSSIESSISPEEDSSFLPLEEELTSADFAPPPGIDNSSDLEKYVMAIKAIHRYDNSTAVHILYDLIKTYPRNIALKIRLQDALLLEEGVTPIPKSTSDKVLTFSSEEHASYIQALKALGAKNKQLSLSLLISLANKHPESDMIQLRLREASHL